jgi:hypothetical protein
MQPGPLPQPVELRKRDGALRADRQLKGPARTRQRRVYCLPRKRVGFPDVVADYIGRSRAAWHPQKVSAAASTLVTVRAMSGVVVSDAIVERMHEVAQGCAAIPTLRIIRSPRHPGAPSYTR